MVLKHRELRNESRKSGGSVCAFAGGLHKKQMYRITGTGCGLPGSITAGAGAATAVLCGRKGLLL